MASADLVESIPNFDNKIYLFEKQITASKLEATRIGEEMKELIDKKTFELLRELDRVLREVENIERKINTVNKREIEFETPVIKLNWKMNALRDSINNMCCCEIQEVMGFRIRPDSPKIHHGDRVTTRFEVKGKYVTVNGVMITRFIDKSGRIYYELHTDTPVSAQIRGKESNLKAKKTAKFENSLFVRADQCVPENL